MGDHFCSHSFQIVIAVQFSGHGVGQDGVPLQLGKNEVHLHLPVGDFVDVPCQGAEGVFLPAVIQHFRRMRLHKVIAILSLELGKQHQVVHSLHSSVRMLRPRGISPQQQKHRAYSSGQEPESSWFHNTPSFFLKMRAICTRIVYI